MAALAVGGFHALAATTNNLPIADMVIRSWETKDGLPQNTVYATLQSRDGYLWIGTGGGLARFDGQRFRAFGLFDGLGSVEISALVEDRSGVVWVGTQGGGLSRWEKGRFRTFSTAHGLPSAIVESLAADADGTLWIGTTKGLARYSNGVFKTIGEADGLPESQVRALLHDSKGNLWVSLLARGLFKGTQGRFARIEGAADRPAGIFSLCEDREGAVWAGGGLGHLWRYAEGNWTRYTRTNGLPAENIEALAQGSQGPLWAGVRTAGLFFFDQGNFHPANVNSSLQGGTIRGVMVDRNGMLWVGSMQGICRLSRRVIKNWGVAEGLPRGPITAVAEDLADNRLVCTQEKGFYRLMNGRFRPLADSKVSGKRLYIYTALATGDGSIWTGGESFAVRFPAEQQTEAYMEPPVGGEAIRAMCEDQSGQAVWFGTYHSTLLRWDRTGFKVAAPKGSFGGGITSIVQEAPEALWIGSSTGLYSWERGKIRCWGTGDGLLCSNVRALHRDANGTLWIGTCGGGLARLKQGRILNITTRNGLADDIISQIIADDFGQLWLGCNHGIMRLERRELDSLADGVEPVVHVALLGENEGMIEEQCAGGHAPTAIKTRAGHLLFPTVSGLVEIDPSQVHEPTVATPQPTIEEVLVDGQLRDPTAPAILEPGSQRIQLSYGAPNLRGDTPHFRIRLDPFDNDWVNVGTRRVAAYANLRPGRYVFRVTAGIEQGAWNETAAVLGVTVRPFYWQTLWFQGLAGLAVGGTILAWYLRHVKRLEEKRAAQEAFTRQLMSSQEKERERVASELHDGLGQDLLLIKNRLGLLGAGTKHPEAVARQIAELSANASRALADVRVISHALRPTALEQVGLTKAIEWMVEQNGESSTTKFSCELSNIDGVVAPEMEIQLYRIVQEALNNVLKHAHASEVIVSVKREPQEIYVSILDNGCGFDPERPGGDHQLNFGMTGMKERAKVMGGSLQFHSAHGTGTRLTLMIPVPLKAN